MLYSYIYTNSTNLQLQAWLESCWRQCPKADLSFAVQEPTTGLDAAIANHLMRTLDNYVQSTGKTVITTIHQPSSQIFHMFSNLLLLSDGQASGCFK